MDFFVNYDSDDDKEFIAKFFNVVQNKLDEDYTNVSNIKTVVNEDCTNVSNIRMVVN